MNWRLLTIIAIACCYNSSFAQSSNEIRLKYLKNETGSKGISKDRVRCYIKIDTVQLLSDAGLRFSVRLKNNLNDTITIGNIMENFNPVLNNDSFNVIYVRYEEFGEPKSRPLKLKSVVVDHVTINGEPVIVDLTNVKDIIIPPKGNYEIFLRISKTRKNKSDDPYDFGKAIPLRKGKYRFLTSIVIKEDNGYEILNFDRISINYKACD